MVGLDRRRFLAFLGVGAATGPAAVKSAAQIMPADLSLRAAGVVSGAIHNNPEPMQDPMSRLAWAKTRLAQITGLSEAAAEVKKREFYFEGFDANIATLRSVSVVHKITMSRDILFERHQRHQKQYLRGFIKGWWD